MNVDTYIYNLTWPSSHLRSIHGSKLVLLMRAMQFENDFYTK